MILRLKQTFIEFQFIFDKIFVQFNNNNNNNSK
jgi:hypothetical protein